MSKQLYGPTTFSNLKACVCWGGIRGSIHPIYYHHEAAVSQLWKVEGVP